MFNTRMVGRGVVALAIVAMTAVTVGVEASVFAPLEGRCGMSANSCDPGTGGSGASCLGTCGNCTDGFDVGGSGANVYWYCGCGEGQQAVESPCCHLVIKKPETTSATWGKVGNCPDCPASGVCTVVKDVNCESGGSPPQAACVGQGV